MGWATVTDVQQITGKVIDDQTIQQATFTIELSSGGRVAAMDTTRVSARNLYWLKLAVAYQAVWQAEQPDYLTRADVSTVSQDGASATFKPDGIILAPLARRALKRLSWRGMRTVMPTTGQVLSTRAVYTSDDYDDALGWRRL